MRICLNPKVRHAAGANGTLDLHGFADGNNAERTALVLVDYGGACGPYRYDELTILSERRYSEHFVSVVPHQVVAEIKSGRLLRICQACLRPEDEHRPVFMEGLGLMLGPCDPNAIWSEPGVQHFINPPGLPAPCPPSVEASRG